MAEEKTTAVAEKKETFSMALTNNLDSVADALPKEFNKTRFVQNAIALLNDNDVLIEYNKTYGSKNILAGLMKGAYLNLDLSAAKLIWSLMEKNFSLCLVTEVA